MQDTDDSLNTVLTRRSLIVAGGGAGVFGVLASRLFYLQVTRAEDYRVMSEDNRFNFQVLVPSRGRIFDRSGEALASNRQDFRLSIVPETIKDLDGVLNNLEQFLPLSPAQRENIKGNIKRSRRYASVNVVTNLTWEEFTRINFNLPKLPGINPVVGEGRRYSEDGVFSHILGYVGRPTERDMEGTPDRVLFQPGFRLGKTGVEKAADKHLRGEAGELKVEVNAFGRVVREWPEQGKEAKAGKDIWLTLDANLQRYGAQQFGEDSGGLAVMDVQTGELHTLLSMPSYDANLFVNGLTQRDMDALNSDERRPQYNKVLSGGYPPASTFKMMVMLAGLEAGLIDPNETVYCNGRRPLGDRVFHCWKRQGHGQMNMRDSLKQSCDVYYYEMIQKIGMDKVKAMAERFGLGQTFDIKIAGQIRGAVPNALWRRETSGAAWRMGDSLNASIGQGFVLSTPLQLAVMTARIANGRAAVSPHLIIGDDMPAPTPLGVDPAHIAFVQEAMLSVTSEQRGTAYKPWEWPFETVQLAGKTGTGQTRGISRAERLSGVLKNDELPWKFRDHSIFVGYAPFDRPRFAAACIVEHGGSGAGRAADIVRKVLAKALVQDGIALKPGATL